MATSADWKTVYEKALRVMGSASAATAAPQSEPPQLLRAALDYAKRGWLVMPLHTPTARGCSCREADCRSVGKHPRTLNGSKDASRDRAVIRGWWKRWPDANVGIATGPESGIFALDVDPKKGGEESLVAWARRGFIFPDTYTVRTGGGGQHHYFVWPEGVDVRNSESKIAPGMDIRGVGGYVVAAPSLHESGARYEINESAIPPEPPPEWLLTLIREAQGPQTQQSSPAVQAAPSDSKIGHPDRWPHLRSLAGTLIKRGMDPTAIEAALVVENAAKCSPPLDEKELREKLTDMVRRYSSPAPSAENGFTLVPIGQLLSRPDVPPDYLVGGLLIRGTVSCVVSKPKVGKSTFARGLCLAVARGVPFLGRNTRQGPCIYLALEERHEEITSDFRSMGAEGTEPIEVHADAAPVLAILALVDLVRRQRPALVVIDPLFRLAHIRDEKAYAEVYAALGPLIDLARETGTHILVTHHSGKSPKVDPIDSPLGSTAIGGAAATTIVLNRRESYRTVQTVTRIGPVLPETELSFDSETRLLSVGGTKAEADCQEIEKAIVEYLEAGGEQTEPEIVEHVEGTNAVKRKALRSLVEKGLVDRAGIGKKGDPYKYSYACTEGIARTSVQETENGPKTRASIDEKVVRARQENQMLVRDTFEVEEQPLLEGEGMGKSAPVEALENLPLDEAIFTNPPEPENTKPLTGDAAESDESETVKPEVRL